jgi:Tfp pilus assembly protein PilN
VKPIRLNLASEPYRDTRGVNLVTAVMVALIAILLVYNVQTAWRYAVTTEQTRDRIAEIQAQTTAERRRAEEVRRGVAQYDLKALARASQTINAQIAERSFSWSALFDRLERVLPDEVRLNSLNPSIAAGSEGVRLDLVGVARSNEAVVEMINAFFVDPHFSRPFPQSERNSSGTVDFSLSVNYLPEARTAE